MREKNELDARYLIIKVVPTRSDAGKLVCCSCRHRREEECTQGFSEKARKKETTR
jgi:hypothetical protein